MERAEGTHRSSEEGLVWAQLLSERFGKTRNASSQFPQIPFATRTQRTLLPDSCPSPRRPLIKTTFLHGHYLFFVPFSFCKKQSQKPVRNHLCGCPVLYYKNS